ncbi:MAG: MoxR family ATPase [Thermoplasmata archaeon]|jgi:MoxR-like ATPase|nr:AAA domain-containing protein [Euryarchaeota archaeon]MVT35964.1 AAA domain-containing protein [Euryarchaeota archaeon]
MDLDEYRVLIEGVIGEVKRAVIGKDDVLKKMMVTIIAKGHILIEDYPGLAKTLIARSFSNALGCDFKRIQFTPDLLPMDILGTFVFNRDKMDFKFLPGPIFTNILLADEINRAPPKTQSALLEAMQEYQVTLEGETKKLEMPFIVIATQNPIEFEGTYPLPEAQLDRFLVKISVGYPSKDAEISMLENRKKVNSDYIIVNNVITKEKLLEMQEKAENIHVDSSIEDYIVEIVTRTRKNEQVEVGSSPRGTLSIFKLSRAMALANGRDFVIPDDVKGVANMALSHRLILKPEPWIRGVKPEDIIEKILTSTPVPKI